MNKQGDKGIEYVNYTWNPVGGCFHQCRWQMPDGEIAICYAERIANGLAQSAYKQGFQHHYWNPDRLDEPLKVKEPARIFLDSMSDLMGAWVEEEQIRQVLDTVRKAHWHRFLLLTKNPGRLLKFRHEYPSNLWVGVSMPPTWMNGKALNQSQKERYVNHALEIMHQLGSSVPVRWWSFEPLSWNVWNTLVFWRESKLPFEWAVIGAASHGKQTYQPDPKTTRLLLEELDEQKIPVFFKGNLKWEPHREEYPETLHEPQQLEMF